MYNITRCEGCREKRTLQLIPSTNAVQLNKTSRRGLMLRVHSVDLSPCKLPRAYVSYGGLRRTGGMCVVWTLPPPPPCRGGTTKPGPLCWHGRENRAIRCLPNACAAAMEGVSPEATAAWFLLSWWLS